MTVRARLVAPREKLEYLGTLRDEFDDQAKRYEGIMLTLRQLEFKAEVAEKHLCVARDHLLLALDENPGMVGEDWEKVLKRVRFVGRRLADACVELLRENTTMTTSELISGLRSGMFRFKGAAPLREVHAAVMRHPNIKRDGDTWRWIEQP